MAGWLDHSSAAPLLCQWSASLCVGWALLSSSSSSIAAAKLLLVLVYIVIILMLSAYSEMRRRTTFEMKQTLCLSRGFQGGSSSPSTTPTKGNSLCYLQLPVIMNVLRKQNVAIATQSCCWWVKGSRRVHNDMPPSEWVSGRREDTLAEEQGRVAGRVVLPNLILYC